MKVCVGTPLRVCWVGLKRRAQARFVPRAHGRGVGVPAEEAVQEEVDGGEQAIGGRAKTVLHLAEGGEVVSKILLGLELVGEEALIHVLASRLPGRLQAVPVLSEV